MFKRLIMEDWMALVPMIAFLLMFVTFAIFTWRALRMSREKRKHMANLPLEEEKKRPARPSNPG